MDVIDAPDVRLAETAGEVSMLPGTVEMVVGIVAAGIVSDPLAVGVGVRDIGMSGLVGEAAAGGSGGCTALLRRPLVGLLCSGLLLRLRAGTSWWQEGHAKAGSSISTANIETPTVIFINAFEGRASDHVEQKLEPVIHV